jgi:hypothetical protein
MVLPPHRQQHNQFLLPRTVSERRTTEKRWERILTALANMPDIPTRGRFGTDDWRAVVNRPEFGRYIETFEYFRSCFPEITNLGNIALEALRNLVRKAWTVPDRRHAEWYLFQVRRIHEDVRRIREITDPAELSAVLERARDRDQYPRELSEEAQQNVQINFEHARRKCAQAMTFKEWQEAEESGPPAQTPFEGIIFHLQENLHRVLYCKNPTCTTPYFFLTAKGHKGQGQEYCSQDCVVWGKREKNKLWARKSREKGRK